MPWLKSGKFHGISMSHINFMVAGYEAAIAAKENDLQRKILIATSRGANIAKL